MYQSWLSNWHPAEDITREASRMQQAREKNVTYAATSEEWQALEQMGALAHFAEEAFAGEVVELRLNGSDKAEIRLHEGPPRPLQSLTLRKGESDARLWERVKDACARLAEQSLLVLVDADGEAGSAGLVSLAESLTGLEKGLALWYWDGKTATPIELHIQPHASPSHS